MVVYINTVDVESLTGPAAIERAVNVTLDTLKSVGLTTTLAHFKLSSQGITVTDNKHRFTFLRLRFLLRASSKSNLRHRVTSLLVLLLLLLLLLT